MRHTVVFSVNVLAISAGSMGGCADETVVAVYGGFGHGGYSEGGCSLDCFGSDGARDFGGYAPEVPDCYDKRAALELDPAIVGGVEINQNVCTATQISDMFAACIGDTRTQESCDAFIAAAPENQACLNCAVGGGTAPYPMPVALPGSMSHFPSLPACQAEVAGLPECELPYQSWYFCGNTACQGCSTNDTQTDCMAYALFDSELCGFINEIPESCNPLFLAKEWPAECAGGATTFAAAFPVLAELYCGAP